MSKVFECEVDYEKLFGVDCRSDLGRSKKFRSDCNRSIGFLSGLNFCLVSSSNDFAELATKKLVSVIKAICLISRVGVKVHELFDQFFRDENNFVILEHLMERC